MVPFPPKVRKGITKRKWIGLKPLKQILFEILSYLIPSSLHTHPPHPHHGYQFSYFRWWCGSHLMPFQIRTLPVAHQWSLHPLFPFLSFASESVGWNQVDDTKKCFASKVSPSILPYLLWGSETDLWLPGVFSFSPTEHPQPLNSLPGCWYS